MNELEAQTRAHGVLSRWLESLPGGLADQMLVAPRQQLVIQIRQELLSVYRKGKHEHEAHLLQSMHRRRQAHAKPATV